MRWWNISICIMLVMIAAAGSAFATPTGLNIIPTADTLPNGVFSLGGTIATLRPDEEDASSTQIVMQVGIGDRFEFGIDPVISGKGNQLVNAKYRIWDESRYTPAVAFGLENTDPAFVSQPYVIGFKTLPIARFHFGIVGNEGTINALFGIDRQLSDLWVFQADYISGPGNWYTIGLAIGGNTGWTCTPACLVGNSESSGNGYYLDIEWVGRL